MRSDALVALAIIAFAPFALLTGCGGNSSGQVSTLPNTPTTIQYKVGGATPSVVALQINGGAWAPLTLSGSSASFTVPTATSTYGVAVQCPVSGTNIQLETVYEASASDTTTPNSFCPATSVSNVAVSYNGSAFYGGQYASVSIGSFLSPLGVAVSPTSVIYAAEGIQDVGVDLYNTKNSAPLAVQIVRSVNITGAPITLPAMSTSDAAGSAMIAVSGAPSGYATSLSAEYVTAGGAQFLLNGNSASSYGVVAASDTQSGDSYLLQSTSGNGVYQTNPVQAEQTLSSAQNVTLTLPSALNYSLTTPASYQSFSPSYSGFTISGKTGWMCGVNWITGGSNLHNINVYETSAFVGSGAIAIPNLTSVPGFLAPPVSGTTVGWFVEAMSQTQPYFKLIMPTPPANETAQYAIATGTYVEP